MKKHILLVALFLISTAALAQHHHEMNMTDSAKKKMNMKSTKPMMMDGMDMGDMKMDTTTHHHLMMTSQFSRDLPMNRDGSGTSWVPDETPIYGYMIHGKKWMSMVHGSFFARYNNQDLFNSGKRGGKSKFDAPNWLMFMTQHKVGSNGLFSVNTMFSFDPFLVGAGGYPLLYQTGESYQGHKLVDKQHPHDLFAELSVAYTQRVAKDADISLSVGYPGEPALGPPVFMHRLSAMNNPDAPLSHHYQDATHITFGVATLGFRVKNVKLEGSVFTGREPDEYRYDFDKARFDSYSVRLSYNPSKEWAMQISNGWIHSPEEAEPQQNVNRFTASVIHTKMLGINSYVATTLVYGQNHYSGNKRTQPSVLFENTLQLNKTAIYERYEFVQKDAHELDLEQQFPLNPDLNINALTLGVNRILGSFKSTNITGGVQGTLNVSPSALKPLYGSAPVGFEVYLRITPGMMNM
ncbi:hypothetical protein LX99_04273 [Mucilaginibacter oryzae]|uniref:Uncharacterized protein n=1 Tax=Mucilaginibacter oryzae TaxID=468058 RepID=A0A316H0V6_9SPHI|nr:hypothetical protein [Mucilaginibacter oryzae]PWK72942.1 hypothetical protein LX99_04273 [Mucilaginibacter oryzae]